ncbi:hypothetical protein HRQ91_06030 [Treponema parvum]|uniref:Uncharacterized protein n=1 Tax=Treponema parvum TaxID=138851 RepID=A0A975F409_9SPIR|nr:hypothetical protein [Treponema parvum]QTQ14047.1 hypothetical protein HRQ91_06030 [Treponema parvum]
MRWEEFEALETEREYDGYFCSIKNVVVIVILGSLSDLKSVKKIHEWTITEHVRKFLEKEFNIKRLPCYRWLLNLLAMIKSELLNRGMKNWVNTLVPHLSSKIATEEEGHNKKKNKPFTVAIDRKEIHSTRNMTVLLT